MTKRLFDSVWVVEDYKDESLIGIFATEELAEQAAAENINRATCPRQVIITEEGEMISLEGSTICASPSNFRGKTELVWTDPETGEVHVDPAWADIHKARQVSFEFRHGISNRKWWQFWKDWR